MTPMTPCGRRLLSGASAATLVVVLSACAGTGTVLDDPVLDDPVLGGAATSVAPVTSAPVTSVPVTSVPAAVTSATGGTTTAPASTGTISTVVLPRPLAPPDPDATEPLVEIGRIEIARIGIDMPMYEGITLGTLDAGPGHWPGSAMPGQIGNVVVAGHRVSHSRPFRDIDQLQAGDEVVLTTADGRFVYLVDSTEVVEPEAIRVVEQTPASTATLFACHPPGSTEYRYVVHLTLAPADAPAEPSDG
jgi:sortase A